MGRIHSFAEYFYYLVEELVFDVFLLLRKEIVPSFQFSFGSVSSNIWLTVSLLLGIGIRSYFLSQPMRYDESVTFLEFVNRDLQSLFYYPYPNNHVLHTLLVKVAVLIFGANPISIRSIAFLAGVGCIPLIFSLCRQLAQSGIFAALVVSIFPYLVFYSTNARGYTLLVLLTLLLASVGLQAAKKPSVAGAILISLFASSGILTMPSMLFPISGLYFWFVILLLMQKNDLKIILYRFIIPCGLFTVVFSLVLYTPVIMASHGIESIIRNSYINPQPWPDFLGQLYPHITSSLSDIFRDIPRVLIIILVVLVLLGIFRCIQKRDRTSLILLPSILFGSAVILFMQHRIPFARTWIFVIPFFILLADAGFTYLMEQLSPRINLYLMPVTFLVAMVLTISLISSNSIARYSDTGIFSEAPIAAKFLESKVTKKQPNIVFVSKTPATEPINFYLWYYNIPVEFANENSLPGDIIYIVEKSHYSLKDMTDQPVLKIFAIDNLEVYQGIHAEK